MERCCMELDSGTNIWEQFAAMFGVTTVLTLQRWKKHSNLHPTARSRGYPKTAIFMHIKFAVRPHPDFRNASTTSQNQVHEAGKK